MKVGDKFTLQEIQKNKYLFGGEPSGHFIFKDDILIDISNNKINDTVQDIYRVNGSLYIISPKKLREEKSFFSGKLKPIIINSEFESIDIDTVLEENMVVSMEPMIMIPQGIPGAGGYREHDILVIGKNSAEDITKFPFGPEHNIIKS